MQFHYTADTPESSGELTEVALKWRISEQGQIGLCSSPREVRKRCSEGNEKNHSFYSDTEQHKLTASGY